MEEIGTCNISVGRTQYLRKNVYLLMCSPTRLSVRVY